MEHIGTITAAGKEPSADKSKLVFKLHLDNPKYTYTLFDDSQKKFAEENIGKTVKVEYSMSPDEKHRNVESIELATEAQVVAHNGYSDGSDKRCAALIMKDLRIAGCVDDENLLYQAMKKWVATQLNAWPETAHKEPPTYKDKGGNDPSKASTKNLSVLKELLVVDDEDLDLQIAYRFGYETVMSDAECKDWIKELKSQ